MRQIKIGDKWTFDDYGAWLSPGPSVGDAKPKTSFVDIPFSNGSIDLTEALTGEVSYSDRELSFELVFPLDIKDWDALRKQVFNDCHGKRLDIIMPQYPTYIFKGRVSVGALAEDSSVATLPITVNADPFMYKNEKTVVNTTLPSAGTVTVNLLNERMSVSPEFTASAEVKLTFDGNSYSHSAGTFTLAEIYLKAGENALTIEAIAGTIVKIEYQEGAL